MPMFLIEGNELHAELNASKYRDYIYERITRSCVPNLPVSFIGKMDYCKVIILENIQLLVKKDIKSRKTEKTLCIIILLIYVIIVLVWVTSIRVLLLVSVRVFSCIINACILIVISSFLLNMVSLLCMYSYV